MDFKENFDYQIAEISPVLEGKFELMAYFQKKYPRDWNRQLSTRLQEFLPLGKNGKPQSIENIMRRHEKRNGKIPNANAQTAAQYAALGESIGATPPQYGYSVTWKGEIKISGTCAYREFTDLLVAGEDAEKLAGSNDITIIFKTYFQGIKMANEWCGEPEIEIEPAGEDQEQMEFKHGPRESKFEKLFG